jgi:ClpX C4-type zinc finger
MDSVDRPGWKGYAPTDVEPPSTCSFCGEPPDESRMLVVGGDGTVAICEQCVSSHARFFERRRDNGSS